MIWGWPPSSCSSAASASDVCAACHRPSLISTSARLTRPIAIERGSPSWRLMMRFCSSSSLARPRFPVVDLEHGQVVRRHGQFRAVADRGAQIEHGLELDIAGQVAQVTLGRSRARWPPRPGPRLARVVRGCASPGWPGEPPRRSRRSPRPARRPRTGPARSSGFPPLSARGVHRLRWNLSSQARPAERPLVSHQRHGQRRPLGPDRSRRSRGPTAASRAGHRQLTPAGRPTNAHPARRGNSSSGWPGRRNAWRPAASLRCFACLPEPCGSRTPGWPRPC